MRARLLRTLSRAALPLVSLKGLFNRPFRQTLAERKGAGDWSGLNLSGSTVWIHAASVGEIGGVVPVLKKLKELRDDISFIVTTTSETGKAELKRRAPDCPAALFPLDYPAAVKSALDRVRPCLVLIAETELWPNFMLELEQRRIPVLLFNGRISDRSYPRYKRFRSFVRPLLESFAKLMVQTHLDAERFIALGAPRENIMVCGSTKYANLDERAAESFLGADVAARFNLDAQKATFVAGSIRPGEEEIVVAAVARAREALPQLQVVLAPRHLERADILCALLDAKSLSYAKRSSGNTVSPSGILVLDTHGELRDLYALASVAFVGGSLVDIGGHNPLEPAAFGVPVIFGPYDRNVRDAIGQLKQAGGVATVTNATELAAQIILHVRNEGLRKLHGEAAKRVAEQNSRALEHVLPIILRYLPTQVVRVIGNVK